MPNWCYNSLCVSGNKEILADFVSKTLVPCNMSSEEEYDESHRFTFNILHPTPQALEGNTSPLRILEGEDETQFKERMAENLRLYGAEDWYRWHLDNWGTKWDAKSTSVEQLDDTNFNVQFHTAWSPPIDWFEKIIPMYPQLEFDLIFDEESLDFCGRMTGIEGEVDLQVGKPYFTDEEDNRVIYDLDKHQWKYEDSGKLIDDEDFFPIDVNPYG
jgi:hypothetical protein